MNKLEQMIFKGLKNIHKCEYGPMYAHTGLVHRGSNFVRSIDLQNQFPKKKVLVWKQIPFNLSDDEAYNEMINLKDSYLKSFKEDKSLMDNWGFDCMGYGTYKHGNFLIDKWFSTSNFLPMYAITIWFDGKPFTEYSGDLQYVLQLWLEEKKNKDKVNFLPSQLRDWMIEVGFPKINYGPSGG